MTKKLRNQKRDKIKKFRFNQSLNYRLMINQQYQIKQITNLLKN